MATNRAKLDYNNLISLINETISCSGSISVRRNGLEIKTGLTLLTQCLQKIAERAIELKDDVLLEILLDMDVIKRSEREVGGNG